MTTRAPLLVLARGARAPARRDAALTINAQTSASVDDAQAGRERSLILRLERGELALLHDLNPPSSLSIERTALGATLDLSHLSPPLDAVLLGVARRHDEARPLASWLREIGEFASRRRRRTLVVSVVGWEAGVWYDGPLAHVLPSGNFASYVPTGGPAALALPVAPSEDLVGVDLATALALEGTADEALHRTMLAAVDAQLPGDGATVRLLAEALDARTALALALLRQARPEAPITLVVPGGKHALPPAWRRFTENAALIVAEGSQAAFSSTLLGSTLAPKNVAALARQVNSISEILPKSIL